MNRKAYNRSRSMRETNKALLHFYGTIEDYRDYLRQKLNVFTPVIGKVKLLWSRN